MSERGNVVARDSLLILFSSAIFALHPMLFCGNGFGLVGQAGFEPATT